MKTIAGIVTALVLLAVSPITGVASAGQFTLDKNHAEIRFSWDHLGLSRQSGRFGEVSATLSFDPEKPEATTVTATIPISSLSTGVAALDSMLLKSRDYFDVAGAPVITFKSAKVHMTGDKSAEMTGDLTLNGVTKPVTLAVVLNFTGPNPLGAVNPTFAGQTVAGFSARTQILRSEWGIARYIPLVSDELRISIEAEFLADQ